MSAPPIPVKVFVLNDRNQPSVEGTARNVSCSNRDDAKAQVKKMLEAEGYTIRALNYGVNDEFIAYVYPKGVRAPHAKRVEGWVWKRPAQ